MGIAAATAALAPIVEPAAHLPHRIAPLNSDHLQSLPILASRHHNLCSTEPSSHWTSSVRCRQIPEHRTVAKLPEMTGARRSNAEKAVGYKPSPCRHRVSRAYTGARRTTEKGAPMQDLADAELPGTPLTLPMQTIPDPWTRIGNRNIADSSGTAITKPTQPWRSHSMHPSPDPCRPNEQPFTARPVLMQQA